MSKIETREADQNSDDVTAEVRVGSIGQLPGLKDQVYSKFGPIMIAASIFLFLPLLKIGYDKLRNRQQA